jgi:hypothetical protein
MKVVCQTSPLGWQRDGGVYDSISQSIMTVNHTNVSLYPGAELPLALGGPGPGFPKNQKKKKVIKK